MKKYLVILTALLLAGSLWTATVVAQPFGSGSGVPGANKSFRAMPRGGMNAGALGIRGLMSLDLTEAQREEIAQIMDEHRQVMLEDCQLTREKMNSLRDRLATLMNDYNFSLDQSKLEEAKQLLIDKSAINIEKQLLRLEVHNRILHEVLTPEQREQLENQRANAQAFGPGSQRSGAFGMRGGRAGNCPF